MPTTTVQTPAPPKFMQGIAVPASSVRPAEFLQRTRRHTNLEQQFSYTGQPQQTVELRKSDILSGILIRFSGQVVVNHTTGTVATTARWPYDFIKNCRFTANGAANLINVSGAKLKARDLMKKSDLTDRGVAQTVAGVSQNQGTLSLATESWGVGSNTTGLAAGTYDIDLEWVVPVAEDEQDLAGAIFLATSTSDLTLTLDLATMAELFVLTGDGTASLTGSFQVVTNKFSIPIGSDGQIVVPDLSSFHSLVQSRTTAVQNGENEFRLIGQGIGKALLRVYAQLWNGAGTAAAPLPVDDTNFGRIAWRYGTAETPDDYPSGGILRADMERRYNADLGRVHGFAAIDFVAENAFRDVVDEGTTSDLRLVVAVASGVALSSPAIEYVAETMYLAGQAA